MLVIALFDGPISVVSYVVWNCWVVLQYLAEFFFRIWSVSGKSYRENQNTHFVFSNFLFPKKYCLWDDVENYGRTTQIMVEPHNYGRTTQIMVEPHKLW
jgi:hypothetical protein